MNTFSAGFLAAIAAVFALLAYAIRKAGQEIDAVNLSDVGLSWGEAE